MLLAHLDIKCNSPPAAANLTIASTPDVDRNGSRPEVIDGVCQG